jgi:hypothetical protein
MKSQSVKVDQTGNEGLIGLQKIKVNQGKSSQIKVNQAILKHFYFQQNQTEPARAGNPLPAAHPLQASNGAKGVARPTGSNLNKYPCKYFIMNNLQTNQPPVRSSSVKLGQTDFKRFWVQADPFRCLPTLSLNREITWLRQSW